MEGNSKKVYVAMSGGVDSSLSAALLKEEGYDVTGIFIKVWQPDWLPCTWRDERKDAMRVCAKLGIPFETMYLESEYKKHVADYLVSEYKAGRTPNPDVMCNKYVKFGSFLEKSLESGADMIATGHYARVQNDEGIFRMLVGVDGSKDQSYFLWTLSQEVLSKTLFPVGELSKPKVREEAEKRGLHNAKKKDSQGICFLGDVDIKEFLKHYIDVSEGEVLDTDGEVIGYHDGALLYTLGQRHGFSVIKKGPNDGAHYVTGKDLAKNTITVSSTFKTDSSGVKEVAIESLSWTSDSPKVGDEYSTRYIYRQPLQSCRIKEIDGNHMVVAFSKSQKGVTSGQSLVLYEDEECLGGGVIV